MLGDRALGLIAFRLTAKNNRTDVETGVVTDPKTQNAPSTPTPTRHHAHHHGPRQHDPTQR